MTLAACPRRRLRARRLRYKLYTPPADRRPARASPDVRPKGPGGCLYNSIYSLVFALIQRCLRGYSQASIASLSSRRVPSNYTVTSKSPAFQSNCFHADYTKARLLAPKKKSQLLFSASAPSLGEGGRDRELSEAVREVTGPHRPASVCETLES